MKRILLVIGLVLISQTALPAESDPNQESRNRLMPGAVPGTVRFAGSDTSFGIGGRLETHAVFSDVTFASSQSGRDRLKFAQIPVESTGDQKDQFRFNSRDSRFWFQLQQPVANRDLDVYLEYDLTENPASYSINLRHAYISIGRFLAGRSYTTFIDSSVLPDVDTGSASGEIFLKRSQLRWTQRFNDDSMELAVALEEADSQVIDSGSSVIRGYDDDQRPALASRLTWREDWGQLAVSTLVRSVRWQQNGKRLSNLAGGVGLSGIMRFGAVDNLRFMANYGNGLGRFITSDAFADASVSTNFRELNTHSVFSVLAAYQHYWNEEWRSTLSLSMSRSGLPRDSIDTLTKKTRSAQVNLFWSPVPELSIGFEYLHGQRQLLNSQDGELNRLMFSTRYTLQL